MWVSSKFKKIVNFKEKIVNFKEKIVNFKDFFGKKWKKMGFFGKKWENFEKKCKKMGFFAKKMTKIDKKFLSRFDSIQNGFDSRFLKFYLKISPKI